MRPGPLKTDEPAEPGRRANKAFEAELMGGCMTILVLCLTIFGLAVVPFLLLSYLTITDLLRTIGISAILSFPVGVIGVRKTGLAGAVGFAGGAMGMSVFLYLRLEAVTAISDALPVAVAEYPAYWQALVPSVWILAAVTILLLAWPNSPKQSS